jgi:DNA-binding CsgD family transcriptional regulator
VGEAVREARRKTAPDRSPNRVFRATSQGHTGDPEVKLTKQSSRPGNVVDRADQLERGRESYARRAWTEAYEFLSSADRAAPLNAEELELLATSAYMLGMNDEYRSALERAHQAYLDDADNARAARCAFWVGLDLMVLGEMGPAMGWFARAQRLLDREKRDCVERGYLLIPTLLGHVAGDDSEAAYATAAEAAEIGMRFGDADLVALVVQEQGHALVRLGRSEEGLRLLDETMVAVTTGELSPIVTGLVYCNTIGFCQSVYELRRARDWTAALTRWWEEQPDMVAFTGRCLVHRAEIMELSGAWRDALEEARRAGGRPGMSSAGTGQAFYLQGEVHRLQGEFAAAEEAYRGASRFGWEPQPGLALLRLAQGNAEAATAAIRRAVSETVERMARTGLLPAHVEIMLAAGDLEEARSAARELEEISNDQGSEVLAALLAQAQGAVALGEGDAAAALVALRTASHVWQELEAPYEAARVRVLIGLACRALGDEDTAVMELEAARGIFERLGAAPDLARADALVRSPASVDTHGLTARELQVLRMVAAGATNKAIAAELVLSERTIDRHVSNIFTKLGVNSRAAATAFAYEHKLV